MKVKVLVEFDVSGTEDDDGDEDERVAEAAVGMAVFDNLTFSKTGESTVDEVEVHVDGHGPCTVRLCDNE